MSSDLKAPLKPGSVRSIGIFWSIAFLALGIIAIREALIAFNVISGSVWLASVARQFDGLRRGEWLIAVAVVCGIGGLILLGIVFKPRGRVGLSLSSESPVFMTPGAAASVALTCVRQVDGVISASAKASSKRLDLTAKTTSTDAELKTQIRTAVDRRLLAIESKPTVKVHLRQQKGDS